MNKKTRDYSEYPLKKRLIQIGALVVIASMMSSVVQGMFIDGLRNGRAPNSDHDKSEAIFKDETVYIHTDEYGKAESTVVDAYITNNKEKGKIVDKCKLDSVENTAQVKNEPQINSDGTLTWQADGKDVAYEGVGKTTDLPVEIKVEYYLDGEKLKNTEVRGCSGNLKIVLTYKSNDKTTINDQPSKIPYFAMSLVTFGENYRDIKVSNGQIIETGGSSIVICNALAGATEVLGADGINGISDTVTISGKASSFGRTEIVTVLNGDLLKYIDEDTIEKMNLDDNVDKLDDVTRKIMAASRKSVDALKLVDKQIMPKAKATTKAVSKAADELAKETPAFLVNLRDKLGRVAAVCDVSIYVVRKIIDILYPDEDKAQISAKEDLSEAQKKEIEQDKEFAKQDEEAQTDPIDDVDKFINGDGTEDNPSLASKLQSSIEAEQATKAALEEELANLDPEAPDYEERKEELTTQIAKLDTSIDEQQAIITALENQTIEEEVIEGIANKAKRGNDEHQALEKKLEEIAAIFNPDWLKTQLENGDLKNYLSDEEYKRVQKYIDEFKTDEGDYKSVEDILEDIPVKTGYLYTMVDTLLSKENQKSIVQTTKKIAKAMRTVDKVTNKLSGVIKKAANKSDSIYGKVDKLYKKYVLNIIKMYNSNIRGLTDKISKLKAAEDKAGVYSGLSKDMEGTSTYMIFTPVGETLVDLSEETTETNESK